MKAPAGRHVLIGAAFVVVVAAVVTGIVVLGPPSEQRALRLDQRRSRDLQAIGLELNALWKKKRHLPASLQELSTESDISNSSRDPVSGTPYPYRVVDDETFELCATFDRASTRRSSADFWVHGAGRHCFEHKASEVVHQFSPE